jgi:hypothetical protein
VYQVEQTGVSDLLSQSINNTVDDVFELAEKAIDHVSRRCPIEATGQPTSRILTFSFDGTNTVDVLIMVKKLHISPGGLCSRVYVGEDGANTSKSSKIEARTLKQC